MKKASIVSIGNELLNGQTVDTNSNYLSGQLFLFGIPTVSCRCVGDDLPMILRALEGASEDADIIFVTGGLGPTDDDITRKAMADFLSVKLEYRADAMVKIEEFFRRRDISMVEKNRSQAYAPRGARLIDNERGTAPGLICEKGGKVIFVMPGVPREMRGMFEGVVAEELAKVSDTQAIVRKKIRCFGTGESKIAEMLGDLMERGANPLVNCTVQGGVISLDVIATAAKRADAENMAEEKKVEIKKILGDLVFGDGNVTLAEVAGAKLAEAGKTVSVAESCTGGLIAKMITDVSGSSGYFRQGWVTYSNESKVAELGVSDVLIGSYGAVSAEVAEAMAKGARERAGSDYSLSVTGIAGPGGGSELKPVGLVYIGFCSDKKCESRKFQFSGSRDYVRFRTAQAALNLLRLEARFD